MESLGSISFTKTFNGSGIKISLGIISFTNQGCCGGLALLLSLLILSHASNSHPMEQPKVVSIHSSSSCWPCLDIQCFVEGGAEESVTIEDRYSVIINIEGDPKQSQLIGWRKASLAKAKVVLGGSGPNHRLPAEEVGCIYHGNDYSSYKTAVCLGQ